MALSSGAKAAGRWVSRTLPRVVCLGRAPLAQPPFHSRDSTVDIAPGEEMAAPRLFILRTLPGRSHLSGPEFHLRTEDRFRALTLALLFPPIQDWLSVSLRMRPTCRQFPLGSAPGQVLLSFLPRAPLTAGEVKDS
ncbi:PREDICTED: uncharacterized protein LOC105515743 [Colobus angolensis palliatus]|uniref:uncharacterized protein LOC105515743 n=1 Tax=Colobus angolensis palliatus TaxID=336983 RepID=UPI0005F52810|nr:PREDICTED: uncharacterized protein LOC105515743 [Colobus angolensis palliatus]